MDPIRLRTGELAFGGLTHVMAVINLSPESRNRQSYAESPEQALEMAREYRDLGVSVIDLGGQSSHYENPTISEHLEIDRLVPAVELLVDDGFMVSVDTWKPAVAEECLAAGAVLLNDTGGLADERMRKLAAGLGVGAFVMYIEGEHPHDVDEVEIRQDKAEITAAWMADRLASLAGSGVTQTILDPGISINYRGDYAAYTRMQLEVIRSLAPMKALGRPVLVPIPRKQEDHRVAAYIAMALAHEADIIRVHDVALAIDLVALFDRRP